MKVELIEFAKIEIDGAVYDYDVVIDKGKISKRKKKASKQFRDRFGHTPLSVYENIPWGGKQLIIGTGVYNSLPVMDEVLIEAERRGIELKCMPVKEACELISQKEEKTVRAILHITC